MMTAVGSDNQEARQRLSNRITTWFRDKERLVTRISKVAFECPKARNAHQVSQYEYLGSWITEDVNTDLGTQSNTFPYIPTTSVALEPIVALGFLNEPSTCVQKVSGIPYTGVLPSQPRTTTS